MDRGEPRPLRRDQLPALHLFLERTAAPVEIARPGGNQELALSRLVRICHSRLATGAEAPSARRVPFRDARDLLSAGLLCKLSASPLPASHRPGAADPGRIC